MKGYLAAHRGASLPLPRSKTHLPRIMQKNAVFDYQVRAAVGMLDRMFARGSLEGATAFPELKVGGEVQFNEIVDDPLKRWERFR